MQRRRQVLDMDLNHPPPMEIHWTGKLILAADGKYIVSVSSSIPLPLAIPETVQVDLQHADVNQPSPGTCTFTCKLDGDSERDKLEYVRFLKYLWSKNKVGRIVITGWVLHIHPPLIEPPSDAQSEMLISYKRSSIQPPEPVNRKLPAGLPPEFLEEISSEKPPPPRVANMTAGLLDSLEQQHQGWVFGGLAELIDNAHDAKATRLDISMESGCLRNSEEPLPMLCVSDNGKGMTHSEMVSMLRFGHPGEDENDFSRIGRYGVGFKTGTLRLGDDAVVFSVSGSTRSVGFLSRSLNKDRETFIMPIISYTKRSDGAISIDKSVHSEEQAKSSLDGLEAYSPFSRERIGVEFEKLEGVSFAQRGGDRTTNTGTRIFIFNLKRRALGGELELEWTSCNEASGDKHRRQPDVFIQKIARKREGQTNKEVPLDYSLREYISRMWMKPQMGIYIFNSKVRTKLLAKAIPKVVHFKEMVEGQMLTLTLGYMERERDVGNCGIFLYWRGRLIEAYKRAGVQLRTDDSLEGLGVIGYVDVSPIIDSSQVLNNKQGFDTNSETYQQLEAWLGKKMDEYCTGVRQNKLAVAAIQEKWVQCDACMKWRNLNNYNKKLPSKWYCNSKPFEKSCDVAEDDTSGTITISSSGPVTKDMQLITVPQEGNMPTGVSTRFQVSSLARSQKGGFDARDDSRPLARSRDDLRDASRLQKRKSAAKDDAGYNSSGNPVRSERLKKKQITLSLSSEEIDGKSRDLMGLYSRDAGEIRTRDEEMQPKTPGVALALPWRQSSHSGGQKSVALKQERL